jgi:hypothetical protein
VAQHQLLTPTPAPWQVKELGYGAKLGLMIVGAVLAIIMLVGLFGTIGMTNALVHGSTSSGNLIALVVFASMLVVGLGGLILLWPYLRAGTNFTPSYGSIPPATAGAPFEVKYQRYLWGRSMRGTGGVRFDADGLTIEGNVEPHALFQAGVVLVLTLLPLLLFGVGLGIIPALILAYYLGRKKIARAIPYAELREVRVEGRKVTFRTDGSPKTITFAVASVDGERLYRELLPRFPAALGGWMG